MTEETQLEAVMGRQMVTLNAKGSAPGAELYEASITLYDVPRAGDQISVWDGRYEVYVKVGLVTWPAWGYEHLGTDERRPELWLERDEALSDEEWADIFAAIKEGRHP